MAAGYTIAVGVSLFYKDILFCLNGAQGWSWCHRKERCRRSELFVGDSIWVLRSSFAVYMWEPLVNFLAARVNKFPLFYFIFSHFELNFGGGG